MIIVSDETGCMGASYVRGSTKSYIISIGCFNNIEAFVDAGRLISRPTLGTPLRKWAELKSNVKNNPTQLEYFVDSLFNRLINNNNFFVFSFFILNKQEVEGNVSIDFDKKIIKMNAMSGYEYCFKRIFPFIRKWNYVSGNYSRNYIPETIWYIDINNAEFQKQLYKSIIALSDNRVNLQGPRYISKTIPDSISEREAEKQKNIRTAIKIIDIFGGIVSRAFDFYSSYCESCPSDDCFSYVRCKNQYINVWKKILSNTTNIDIIYRGESFWKWNGIIYSPSQNRNNHSRFFKSDSFFT